MTPSDIATLHHLDDPLPVPTTAEGDAAERAPADARHVDVVVACHRGVLDSGGSSAVENAREEVAHKT